MKLGLEEWISFGLSVALNGERCSIDTTLSEDDEVALLPPVSGG
jgi:molybdopterin converting factor small subunit